MKIFFAASIRGGRANQPNFEIITEELKKYGTLDSDHVSNTNMSQFGETSMSATEISEREKTSVKESDVMVAEVTSPSLGVGYLVSYATSLNKKVFALYNGENSLKLSAMIKGDSLVTVQTYTNDEELKEVLKNCFNSL